MKKLLLFLLLAGSVLAQAVLPLGGALVPGQISPAAPSGGAATFSSVTDSGLTATRVVFSTAGGLLTDNAVFTFNSGTGALSATSFVGNTAASTVTGTTMASNVVTSSLTTVGVLGAGSIGGSFGSINVGSNSITGGAISGTTGTFTTSGMFGSGTVQSELLTLNNGASGDTFIRFDKSSGSNTFQGLIGVAQTAGHGSSGSLAGDAVLRSQTNVLLDVAGTTRVYVTPSGLAVTGAISSTTNITNGGVAIFSTDTLSGAGAVSVTKDTTKLTSTGTLQAITLADGVDGQIKHIIHDVDGGSMVLTPTTKTGFTTVTFTNAGDSATLEFVTTRGWIILSVYGAVAA